MKTAEEVIGILKELPPEEWRKVADYIDSERGEEEKDVYPDPLEDYSEEDISKILHDADEARRGINISGPFATMEDAIAHLDELSGS